VRVESLPQNLRTVLFFGWPQAAAFLLWWGQSQSYRFILEHIAGLAYVGLYAVAAIVVSQTMQTLKALFDEYYAPKLFGDVARATTNDAKADVWNSYMSAYGPFMVLSGLALFGSVAFWPKLLLGSQYQAIALLVIWPIIKDTIESLTSTLWTLGIVKADMRMNILPVAVGAVISPSLVFILAPINPLHGTGAALAIGAVIVFAIIVPVSRRALPIKWPIKRLVQAVALGSPLIVIGVWTSAASLTPSLSLTLGALAAIGVYVAAAQWLLSRSWFATFDQEPQQA
jgi:O-antigen/teichoic acid export membrane protein